MVIFMEELKLNSGLKKIAIKDEDGDLITVLSVNVADADTAERFAKIINDLQEISANCEKEAMAWKKEHEQDETVSGEIDVERVLQINHIRVKYLKQITEEIDKLFGEGTVQSIYGDITPDETALVEFVEGVIPVMNKLFGKRYEMTRKRYNSGRKGARA
nr:MAG TPA: tail assembly chaperone [Siphoviridae sp. ctoD011]